MKENKVTRFEVPTTDMLAHVELRCSVVGQVNALFGVEVPCKPRAIEASAISAAPYVRNATIGIGTVNYTGSPIRLVGVRHAFVCVMVMADARET